MQLRTETGVKKSKTHCFLGKILIKSSDITNIAVDFAYPSSRGKWSKDPNIRVTIFRLKNTFT